MDGSYLISCAAENCASFITSSRRLSQSSPRDTWVASGSPNMSSMCCKFGDGSHHESVGSFAEPAADRFTHTSSCSPLLNSLTLRRLTSLRTLRLTHETRDMFSGHTSAISNNTWKRHLLARGPASTVTEDASVKNWPQRRSAHNLWCMVR